MSKPAIGHSPRIIQSVFVLLLLSLFACLSTFLVTMGAQIYRNTVESSEVNSDSRVMTAVVRSAVWAEDGGEVRIEHFDDLGITALCVVNNYDGEVYLKRLYCAVDNDPLDGEPRPPSFIVRHLPHADTSGWYSWCRPWIPSQPSGSSLQWRG